MKKSEQNFFWKDLFEKIFEKNLFEKNLFEKIVLKRKESVWTYFCWCFFKSFFLIFCWKVICWKGFCLKDCFGKYFFEKDYVKRFCWKDVSEFCLKPFFSTILSNTFFSIILSKTAVFICFKACLFQPFFRNLFSIIVFNNFLFSHFCPTQLVSTIVRKHFFFNQCFQNISSSTSCSKTFFNLWPTFSLSDQLFRSFFFDKRFYLLTKFSFFT